MAIGRWTNGILAIWLAVSAFLGFTVVGNVVNAVLVGAIITVTGVGIALAMDERTKWPGWTAAVAGVWLMFGMFVPGLRTGVGLAWNSVIVGAVVLMTALVPEGRPQRVAPTVRAPAEPSRIAKKPEETSTPREEPEHEEEREPVHH